MERTEEEEEEEEEEESGRRESAGWEALGRDGVEQVSARIAGTREATVSCRRLAFSKAIAVRCSTCFSSNEVKEDEEE